MGWRVEFRIVGAKEALLPQCRTNARARIAVGVYFEDHDGDTGVERGLAQDCREPDRRSWCTKSMNMSRRRVITTCGLASVGLYGLLLTACSTVAGRATSTSPAQTPPPVEDMQAGVSMSPTSAQGCPVTVAPATPFSPPAPWPALVPFANRFWYGSPALWIALPSDGDGYHVQGKSFWWSQDFGGGSKEEMPNLAMTARRTDGPAPQVNVPAPATNAYHPDFGWAMLSWLDLPTPGCWQITGSYRAATLSFVVWVSP